MACSGAAAPEAIQVHGAFCGTQLLVSCPAGCNLDKLRKERAFGTFIPELGQLIFSAEEALFLMAELSLLVSVSEGRPDRSPQQSGGEEVPGCLAADAVFSRCCRSIPDFPQRYAAYRHFRRKGWIVRPDAFKFGADFLLYDGEPDEVHAQYAVLLAQPHMPWKEVLASSRLAQTVAKELVLVLFLGLADHDAAIGLEASPMEGSPSSAALQAFLASPLATVSEVLVRRWHAHPG